MLPGGNLCFLVLMGKNTLGAHWGSVMVQRFEDYSDGAVFGDISCGFLLLWYSSVGAFVLLTILPLLQFYHPVLLLQLVHQLEQLFHIPHGVHSILKFLIGTTVGSPDFGAAFFWRYCPFQLVLRFKFSIEVSG